MQSQDRNCQNFGATSTTKWSAFLWLWTFISLFAASPTVIAENFKDAEKAYSVSDYERAAEIWAKLSAKGDPASLHKLAFLYEHGLGVKQDIYRSLGLYTLAASGNNSGAQLDLGNLLYKGIKGVSKDADLAIYWWKRAALNDAAEAQYRLGQLFAIGVDVQRNLSTARKWLKKASDLDHGRAKSLLASLDEGSEEDEQLELQGEVWVMQQNPDHYTIVAFHADHLNKVKSFIAEGNFSNQAVLRNKKGGYFVVSGAFSELMRATEAISKINKTRKNLKPYTVRFSSIQRGVKTYSTKKKIESNDNTKDVETKHQSSQLPVADTAAVSSTTSESSENGARKSSKQTADTATKPSVIGASSTSKSSRKKAADVTKPNPAAVKSKDTRMTHESSVKPQLKGASDQASTASNNVAATNLVNITVMNWTKAWSSRNPDKYFKYYSQGFKSDKHASRAEWKQSRRNNLLNKKLLVVGISDMQVSIKDDRATVRFIQRYTSDSYQDTTRKQLDLRLEDGKWLIVKEITNKFK